jgi:hypothetical protein
MFWVISVYFNIRNILPKSGTFLLGHPIYIYIYLQAIFPNCRSQWPRGLRRRYTAARLLRLWVQIPPGAWIFVVSVELSGRGLCDELITRPEESYRLWCVVLCDLENLKNEEVMTHDGSQRHRKTVINVILITWLILLALLHITPSCKVLYSVMMAN